MAAFLFGYAAGGCVIRDFECSGHRSRTVLAAHHARKHEGPFHFDLLPGQFGFWLIQI
jgi:hypothetical protein